MPMSLPVVKYEKGLMIITHPTGVIETITETGLNELKNDWIEVIARTNKQIEKTNLQISKSSLSLTR